ncbi:O-antigen/teichoic acid export membrane protein [Rhodococcus sp. PvR044]|nr:O-antigen/teichoic acid export membrane protein [Rhodococcus sp. OK611]SNX91824.1 Membrane protein involved in the export of O-antigen and teichoic acid [Rhodococcus sp. OK270]
MAEKMPQDATAPPHVANDRIVRAFGTQLVFRILGMSASVVTVALTARHLGPGPYGQLTIAIVFIGMWTSLTELGIGAVIVRRATSGRGELHRLVRVNSGLSVLYCVPLAVIAAGSGMLVYDDPAVRSMLVIVAISLVLTSLTTCFEPVFLTTIRFTAVAVSDFVSRLASLGATAYLVSIGADVIWFAVVQLIPPAVTLVIQGAAAARIHSWRPVFSLAESRSLIRESLPQMGVLIIAALYWRIDGVILSLLSTPEEVGAYGLAYTLAFTTLVLSTFFLKSSLSTMTEIYARDRSAFATFLRHGVETMFFLGVPIGIVGAMLSGPLIALLADEKFVARGGPTLALLFIAAAVRFVTGTLGQALFAAHDQVFLFRLSIATVGLNIALNISLASHFGAVGAGAALVCTEVFGLLIATWQLGRNCGYRTPGTFLLRLLVPSAVSVAVVLALSDQHVLVTGAAAAASYLLTNLAVGPVTARTIRSIRGGDVISHVPQRI